MLSMKVKIGFMFLTFLRTCILYTPVERGRFEKFESSLSSIQTAAREWWLT